ncbi:MFS transporter [Solihabitans fulvus]|uniref:MFS transporter n=1 Tax=Solihabitans fulvus TaxID=1892852 RepID=A0A5B2XFF3_9PSEU|nr:MFS transporter [Solihabitans fulvus]KAA2262568.1 MFS transporter [Solihabitans fulvus]
MTGQRSRWIALGTLVLAVLLIAVDATVLGLAIPSLTEDLRPTSTQLLWIGDSYSFVLAGLLVTMGTLGDRIGRKRLLLIGAAAFGLMSVLAAYATSPVMLIAARGLLGVAGATLMPSTLSIIRNLFTDDRERTLAIGVWGAMASAGAAVGPVVGGLLLEHFWWGSVFLINVPVMVLLIAVGAVTLPESRDPSPGPWDLASAALSLVGVVSLVYAVKELAAGAGWPTVLAGLVVGVAALTWFVRRQLRLPVPLVDVRLFADRAFTGAVLAQLLAILGLSALAFFMSQFLQLVQGLRPLEAGVRELPATAGAVLFGLVAGAVARRWSPRATVTAGLAAIGVAMAAVLGLRTGIGFLPVGLGMFVVGAGAGLALTVTADIVLSSAPKEKAGAASAVSETSYELGAALGIALLGSIITGYYRGAVTLPAGVPEDVASAARDSLGGAVTSAGGLPAEVTEAVLSAARDTFVDGMRLGSAVGAVLLLAAAGTAWVLLRRPGHRVSEPS